MDIINFLIDFMFYSFIDGIICYLFICNIKPIKEIKFKNVVFNAICLALIFAVVSSFIPIVGLSQFCSAILASLYLYFIRKYNLKDSFKCGLISVTTICLIEFIYGILFKNLLDISLFILNLDSILRILSYLILKVIEILIFIAWRCCIMKLVMGGIVRR